MSNCPLPAGPGEHLERIPNPRTGPEGPVLPGLWGRKWSVSCRAQQGHHNKTQGTEPTGCKAARATEPTLLGVCRGHSQPHRRGSLTPLQETRSPRAQTHGAGQHALALVPGQGGCPLGLPPQPLGDWSRVLQTAWTENSDLNHLVLLVGVWRGKELGDAWGPPKLGA